MNAALRLTAEVTEHVNELPAEPIWFGLGGFGGLVVMLLIAYAFRSVGSRH